MYVCIYIYIYIHTYMRICCVCVCVCVCVCLWPVPGARPERGEVGPAQGVPRLRKTQSIEIFRAPLLGAPSL